MDLDTIIHELTARKELLHHAIAALEELAKNEAVVLGNLSAAKRRGRKAMGVEERREVSERMKKFWGDRRKRQSA